MLLDFEDILRVLFCAFLQKSFSYIDFAKIQYKYSVPGCNQALITTLAAKGVGAHLSSLLVILL